MPTYLVGTHKVGRMGGWVGGGWRDGPHGDGVLDERGGGGGGSA